MASTPTLAPDTHDALPPGTRFGELEVLRVLGAGGFGIVYLALDHALQRQVALKEYLPSSMAGRGQGHAVSVRSQSHLETYAVGLRSFVNEARLLAQFNHPSLVKVYRFWEENGTAYMVMPYLQGQTLREARKAMGAPPGEGWIRSVIDPLLDALAAIHRQEVYHRDIAPDNILLPPGEPPVLLDFGAARRAIGGRTQDFTAIVKPSYAPIEQYADAGQQRQGPWTDLYALGAVMYFLLHGRPPTPATARVAQGEGPLLNAADHPQVSPAFVAAVEWALAVRPGDRPQDVAALREALDGRIAPVLPQSSLRSGAADAEATVILPAGGAPYATTRPVTRTEPVAPPAMARASVASGPSMASGASASTGATAARPEAPARKPLAALALGAVLFVAAGAGWWATHRSSGSADGAAVPASAPTAAAAASAAPAAAETPPAPAALARSPEARPVVTPPSDTHRAPIVTAVPTPSQTAQPSERRAAAPVSVAPRASAAHTARAAEPPPRNDTPQPPPTAAAEPTAPAATGPATPREACGKRVLLALAHCMEQQCTTPRFQSHPQCVRVRELMEDRRRRIEMGGSD